jgi:chromosome segregation ATPase
VASCHETLRRIGTRLYRHVRPSNSEKSPPTADPRSSLLLRFLHATNLQTKLQERDESLQYLQEQLRHVEDQQQSSAREEQEEVSKLAASLRSETRKWQDTVAALEGDIEAMKRSQADLVRELETEKGLHKLTKDRLAATEKERQTAETTSEQRTRQLESQIKELQAAAKTNGDALKSRDSSIAQLKQQLSAMEEGISTSTTESAKLKKDLEIAVSEKKAVESSLASLKTDKNSMERDWLQLKAKVATMETQLNERQADANERLEQHRTSVAENAELRFHLFNWIILSIKLGVFYLFDSFRFFDLLTKFLDLLARGVSALNIEKNELFQRLEEEKVPISKWPQRILQQLER